MNSEELMEWARETCNSLMNKNDATHIYNIQITLKPNLLNFDGCDEVRMEIIQTNQRWKTTKILHSTASNYSFTIDEAMEKMRKFVDERNSL
jgi:hypothetical protein